MSSDVKMVIRMVRKTINGELLLLELTYCVLAAHSTLSCVSDSDRWTVDLADLGCSWLFIAEPWLTHVGYDLIIMC